MKLAGKLEKPEEIKSHLQELSDFQVNVSVFTKEGIFLSKGCFSCELDADAALSFSPSPANGSDYSALAYHYSYQVSACAFQTRPVKVENNRLYLELPSAILFFDRRKYFRIQPSKKQPLVIRLSIPGKGEMRLNAGDVSGGGFSVLVPSQMDFFDIGAILSATIAISAEEKVMCRVSVKGLFTFLDVTRIGCEFTEISEKDRSAVVSYCVRRELETRNTPPVQENSWKHLNLCIVDEDSSKKPYSFLEDFFSATTIEPLNAITCLRQNPPDLIMVNTDHAGTRIVLQTVSRDSMLKELPLILIGRKSATVSTRPGARISIKPPYKKRYLLKSVKELAENIQISKEVGRFCWQYFTGGGKKIVIVDPEKNLVSFPFKALQGLEFQLQWIKEEAGIIGAIEAAHPDILIFDAETGSVDPGTLCRMMSLNKALKNIPKIRLLPGGDVPQSSLFDSRGISFLVKPLEIEKLVESINKALGIGI